MAIHIAPLTLHVRIYDEGVDTTPHLYDMKDPYLGHFIIMVNDAGVGRVQGLDGGITPRRFKILCRKLKDWGVKRLEWKHNGQEKSVALAS